MPDSIMTDNDLHTICKNLVGFCNNKGGSFIIGVNSSSFKIEGIQGIENIKYSIENL